MEVDEVSDQILYIGYLAYAHFNEPAREMVEKSMLRQGSPPTQFSKFLIRVRRLLRVLSDCRLFGVI